MSGWVKRDQSEVKQAGIGSVLLSIFAIRQAERFLLPRRRGPPRILCRSPLSPKILKHSFCAAAAIVPVAVAASGPAAAAAGVDGVIR